MVPSFTAGGLIMSSKLKSSYEYIVLLLVLCFIYFGYSYNKTFDYLSLVAILILLLPNLRKLDLGSSFRAHYTYFGIAALFLIFMFIQVPFSPYPMSSFKVVLVRIALVSIGLLFMLYNNWYKTGYKLILIFSGLHMGFTLFQFLMPEVFNDAVLPLMSQQTKYWISFYMERGYYSGITDQVLKNGFFVTIGMGAAFTAGITTGKKKKLLLFLALFIFFSIALLLTGKRGLLLASAVALVAVALFSPKIIKNLKFIGRKIVPALIIFSLVMVMLFPEVFRIFTKFTIDDISSGRFIIYGRAIKMFLEKPFLGWASGVYFNIFGRGIHNLYLQLLTENGLVGFLLWCTAVVYNLKQVISQIKKERVDSNSQYLKVLLFSLYLQVIFIVHGLTENAMNDSFVFLSYLIAASVPYSYSMSSVLQARKQREPSMASGADLVLIEQVESE